MSLNKAIMQGRIPFDLELKGEEGKEFMGFAISVKRNYKPEGEQYYPEDLLYCKAFRAKAKFIGTYFNKGDDILIEGEIRRDDDYEKDGETVKGQMYINVTDAYFVGGKKSDNTTDGAPAKSAKPTAKPAAKKGATPGLNPLAAGKKKSPF